MHINELIYVYQYEMQTNNSFIIIFKGREGLAKGLKLRKKNSCCLHSAFSVARGGACNKWTPVMIYSLEDHQSKHNIIFS